MAERSVATTLAPSPSAKTTSATVPSSGMMRSTAAIVTSLPTWSRTVTGSTGAAAALLATSTSSALGSPTVATEVVVVAMGAAGTDVDAVLEPHPARSTVASMKVRAPERMLGMPTKGR